MDKSMRLLPCAVFIFCFLTALALGQQTPQQTPSTAAPAAQRKVAITVDDLPGVVPGVIAGTEGMLGALPDLQRINKAIPAILKAHHVPATGFVNEYKLQLPGQRDARAALLQDWIDAGLDLGNHTYSHADFNTTPLVQYEDETIRGEVTTRALLAAVGKRERYFRHPFLNTGITPEAKAAFEAFLAERGYRIAPVTIDASDYEFNDVLWQARKNKDDAMAARAKKEYVEYADTVFDFFEDASRKLFGREIPQVFLMHDNVFNAECLDALLTNLEQRGYKFVSLDEAMADPAYSTPDLFVGPVGISWLERWKVAFGQKPDYERDPDPPAWVSKMFEEIRKARPH